jgi:hypothetical protein
MTLSAFLATPVALWPLLLALPPGLMFVWLDSRSEARAATAELAGAFACSIIPAALASVSGWRAGAALALAALMAGRNVPTVLTIRAFLRRRKGEAGAIAVPLLAALIALVGVGALAHSSLVPPAAVWFMAILFIRAAVLLGPFRLGFSATRLGTTEAIMGGIGVILVALSWAH